MLTFHGASRAALKLLLISVCVTALTGCPWIFGKPDRPLNAASQRCSDRGLGRDARRTCEAVVGKYNYYSHIYRMALQNEARRSTAELAAVAKQILAERAKCADERLADCPSAQKLEQERESIDRYIRDVEAARTTSEASLDSVVESFIKSAPRLRTAARFVCRARPLGTVRCLSVTDFMASYKPDTSAVIAADLNRLYELARPSRSAPVLVNCADDSWIATDFEAIGARDSTTFRQLVAEGAAEGLQTSCTTQSSFTAGSSLGVGGFSGISGIGGGGSLSGFCAAPTDTSAGADKLLGQVMDVQDRFHRQCGYDETGDDPETGSGQTQTVTDNGDGTQTVCTNGSCYVRYKDGVSNSNATQDDLNQTCTSSGDCSVTVSGLDKDNKPVTYSSSVDSSGTKITVIRNEGVQVHGVTGPDGTEYRMICKQGFCSDLSTDPDWKAEKEYRQYEEFYEQLRRRPDQEIGMCPGPNCVSCANYARLITQLKQDCLMSAGRGPFCQSALRTQSCCAGSGGSPTTLVIPNPEGDLACSTRPGEAEQSQSCERKCQTATHPDCIAACKASWQAPFQANLFDNMCKYAYWEACGPGGPPPTVAPPLGGPGPLPELSWVRQLMNFPMPVRR